MKGIIFLWVVLLPTLCLAQIDPTSIKYSTLIDSSTIRKDILVLADDSLLGRNTGQMGQKKAELFIINSFKEAGIKPGNNGEYIQNYDVITNKFNTVKLATSTIDSTSNQDIFSSVFKMSSHEYKREAIIIAINAL